jgi:glycosyltransferase involved in cell wall biosynthesis
MKILFVCSANRSGNCSPIVLNQAESLKKAGITVELFEIKGKGIFGYLKNVIPLRKYARQGSFDLIHAHYWLSGMVSSLACVKPRVVSLMGSDVKHNRFWRMLIRLFCHLSWDACIVKSEDMKKSLGISGIHVIPNGVDIKRFIPMDKKLCKEKLGWDRQKKHILFPSNPLRPEKNYSLAKQALQNLNIPLEVQFLANVPHEDAVFYYNASDVVLMTSIWEGSPNTIKEAMACNCTIVATDVGDISELFSGSDGCFLAAFEPDDILEKLKLAIQSRNNVKGRESVISKNLDSVSIAERIMKLYYQLMQYDRG